MPEVVAGCLLVHACYTDLRLRVIRNWAVGVAAMAGLLLQVAAHGLVGLWLGGAGLAAGAVWWLAVMFLDLGAGDAKLAMAIGVLLGPAAALLGPASGYALCAVAVLPWGVWRFRRGLPWRGVPLPMAPWIAVGTAAVMILRAGG